MKNNLPVALLLAGLAWSCAGRASPAKLDIDAEWARVYGAALQARLAELSKPGDVLRRVPDGWTRVKAVSLWIS